MDLARRGISEPHVAAPIATGTYKKKLRSHRLGTGPKTSAEWQESCHSCLVRGGHEVPSSKEGLPRAVAQ